VFDWEFKCKLFPELERFVTLENGIKQAKYIRSNEPIFSEKSMIESDEEEQKN